MGLVVHTVVWVMLLLRNIIFVILSIFLYHCWYSIRVYLGIPFIVSIIAGWICCSGGVWGVSAFFMMVVLRESSSSSWIVPRIGKCASDRPCLNLCSFLVAYVDVVEFDGVGGRR